MSNKVKIGLVPKSYYDGGGPDMTPIQSLLVPRSTTRSRAYSIHGTIDILTNDPKISYLKDFDQCFEEDHKELLEVIKNIPDLNMLFPEDSRPNMDIINAGLPIESVLAVYEPSTLVSMLIRYALIVEHMQPLLDLVKGKEVKSESVSRVERKPKTIKGEAPTLGHLEEVEVPEAWKAHNQFINTPYQVTETSNPNPSLEYIAIYKSAKDTGLSTNAANNIARNRAGEQLVASRAWDQLEFEESIPSPTIEF